MLPARDEMLTTAPSPPSAMVGTQKRVSRKAVVTLKWNASSKLRSLVRTASRGSQPPALLTRMSMRPSSWVVASTKRSSWLRSVTSQGKARARRPRARTRSAVASISLWVRAAQTTSAPASARASAEPAPIPRPAPVTTATRPSTRKRSRIMICGPYSPVREGPMPYRVIQWATGNVGRLAIEAVLAHPELELAGVWVHSPEKAGQEFGGVNATNDIDAVLGLAADCVVYTPLLGQTAEVVRILESGKNVVTPVGWFYPKDTAGIAELEAACRAGGATLHGTGIHPGGITERFPLTLSALCTNIPHARAEEFSDIRNYQAEAVVREVMLFGKPPDEAAKSPMLDLLGRGLSQSVRMVGDALGLALDEKLQTSHEMAVATKDLDTPVGRIAAGTVAAQRFTWEGLVGGE